MAYKPTRRFITEDGISIEYELRKISTELAATGSGTITGVTAEDPNSVVFSIVFGG